MTEQEKYIEDLLNKLQPSCKLGAGNVMEYQYSLSTVKQALTQALTDMHEACNVAMLINPFDFKEIYHNVRNAVPQMKEVKE